MTPNNCCDYLSICSECVFFSQYVQGPVKHYKNTHI